LGGYCSHAYKANVIAQFGGVGAIFGQLSAIIPSWDTMAQDQELAPQLTIPVNFVALALTNYIVASVTKANGTSLIVTMTYQQDPLFAFVQTPSWAFIQCIFCIWFGVCGIVALVKFGLFVKEQGGVKSTVPQICLFLCFFVCLWYPIATTLNFLGSRNNTSQLTMVVFREWGAVVWLMPVIVFPFYWGELIASTQPVVGLQESKIPFIVALVVIEFLSLAVFIVKGLYGSNPDLIKAQICSVVILSGLFSIYFIVQGIRVIVALGKMQEGFAKTPVQRRTTFLFLCLAALLLGFTIDYAFTFSSGLGIPADFLGIVLFWTVFGALAVAIIVFTLSPKALKEVGSSLSSKIFSGSVFSGTTSQASRDGHSSGDMVEMDKKSKNQDNDQVVETKITI
jgi:type III secretory pathway component EscS